MTITEAKTIFLNRGYIEVNGGTIFDGNKWREACRVISKYLEDDPVKYYSDNSSKDICIITDSINKTEVAEEIKDEIKHIFFIDSVIWGSLMDYQRGLINTDEVIEKINEKAIYEVISIINDYIQEQENKANDD